MKNTDNIEKLFKDSLEHLEADVNPNMWANVQSGITSGSGASASAAGKFTIGKIIIGVASITLVAGIIVYNAAYKDAPAIAKNTKQISHEVSNPETETTAPFNTTAEQNEAHETTTHSSPQSNTPPAIRTLNQYATERTQEQPVAATNSSTDLNDNSSSENSSSANSQVVHKYGNATQGDGGMVRGNANGNISSASNSNNSTTENQNEDPNYPTAVIFVNTSSGEAPLTVDFINQGAGVSLNWDFGDGLSSKENSPTHTFNRPGTYQVKLSAKNSFGSTSDNVIIEVRSSSSITNIPNIFTPNGDGENDYFFFETKNIVSIGVAIYSQKEGKQIYTWNSTDGKWNGKLMNGQDAPEGVYLYSIQANGSDGIVHSKKGFVTLSIKP